MNSNGRQWLLGLAAGLTFVSCRPEAVPRATTAAAPLTCGGSDDTAALRKAFANNGQVTLPAGNICAVESLRIPTGRRLTCEAGAGLKKIGADTSYLLDQSGETVDIEGCVLDGNAQALHNDHQELCRLNSGSFSFTACRFQNVGQRGNPADLTDVLRAWNSSLSVRTSVATDGLSGRVIYFDPNRTMKPLRIESNDFAHLGQSAIWAGNNGGIFPVSMLIANNTIEDCQDDTGGTGQSGNGMQIWQSEGAVVQGNILRANRFSGVRLAKTRHSIVTGNLLQGNREVSMYCAELGGSGNLCIGNMILDYQTGISSTNQEQRQDRTEPDVIANNFLRHGSFMGLAIQGSVAQANVIDGAAIGMRIGIGKSTGHLVRNNICLSSDGTPIAACSIIQYDIPAASIDLLESNTNTSAGYSILPANIGMWQKIRGITRGAQTVVQTAAGGTAPKFGQEVCLAALFGTTGLNGRCAKVVSAQPGEYTLDIDSTNMGDFVEPGGGQEAYSWVAAKSDATPAYAMPNTLMLRDSALPILNLSGLRDGSDFVVPNASCVDGKITAGTSQVRVFKAAGQFVCQ